MKDWLLAERLALVQRLFESSNHSVEAIAQTAGIGSPNVLRARFRNAFGVSPTSWRKSFRGQRQRA